MNSSEKHLEYNPKLSENQNEIVSKLIKFAEGLKYNKYTHEEEIDSFLEKNDFGWLLGVIYDKGQLAERAWRFPYYLSKKLNEIRRKLEPREICNMPLPELDEIFENAEEGYKLRYPLVASASTLRASYRICKKYCGNVRNIWQRAGSPKLLQCALEEFNDIGQKKASMAVNILIFNKKVEFEKDQLSETEISNDKHVRQVILRSGLVEGIVKKEVIMGKSSTKIGKAIVEAGKKLYPQHPGLLDLPIWFIGRDFCHNENPRCDDCYIVENCSRNMELVG